MKKRNSSLLTGILAYLLLLLSQGVLSQNTLSGFVIDETEVSIAGARVTLFNAVQIFFHEEITNGVGTYSFSIIPSGN